MPLYILYRNLHTGMFSLCRKEQEKRGHRKYMDVDSLIMYDAKFKIWDGCQKRARSTGVRNVHAFIHFDEYVITNDDYDPDNYDEVYYNPYTTDCFVYKKSGHAISYARELLGHKGRIFVIKS